jgi:hypothetical protein
MVSLEMLQFTPTAKVLVKTQDIAITFSNYHSFRQILSNGFFFDKKQKQYVQSSHLVTNTFTHNPLIQQTLGYNQSASLHNISYPFVKKLKVAQIDQISTPEDLKVAHPGYNIQQISELNLNEKHVLKKNYFILVILHHNFVISLNFNTLLTINLILYSLTSPILKKFNILDQSTPFGRSRSHFIKANISSTQPCFKRPARMLTTG